MKHPNGHHTTRRRGIAYILALMLLAVFSTLAVVLATTTDLNLRKSDNQRRSQTAMLQAESGLQFMLETIKDTRIPGSTTSSTFPANLADALGMQLNSTANLAGSTVVADSSRVVVPPIKLSGGQFVSVMSMTDGTHSRLEVTGSAGQLTRKLSVDCNLVTRRPAVFDYGLASKGQILVHGNAQIVGVNYAGEASVLSATQSTGDAIKVDGSVKVTGDLYTSGAGSHIAITGTPEIAGTKNPILYGSHLHVGVDAPDFPEVDTAPLAALANGDVITAATNIGNSSTYTNVRIAAGANPTFNNKVTMNGIVYIEAPNKVTFAGGAVVRGIVVTQANTQPLSNCQLRFEGHVEAYGVETLPDTAQFTQVKQQTGTFVAAPGFGVTFAGNFSAINGCIAADQLTFTGTAEGTVKGSVIGLKDVQTDVGGNVSIFVDRKNADQDPAGFINSIGFEPDQGTYAEIAGG